MELRKKFRTISAIVLCTPSLIAMGQTTTNSSADPLKRGFITPPDTVQTSVYWYWLSDNISKEGVEKDLEAMKRVGINRAFIGNIGLSDIPYGKVKLFSDEWWNITHAALKKATELNVEIGMFNGPGWSQSGGPWIKPEQTMRYLSSTKTIVDGGKTINQRLNAPAGLQDVKVIAFPAPSNYNSSIADAHPSITSMPAIQNTSILMDGNKDSAVVFPKDKEITINITSAQPYAARNIVIYPLHENMQMDVELQAEQNGSFQSIKKFTVDRSNNALNVGFETFAPVNESFAEVTSGEFRVIISNKSEKAGITEIEISSLPKVERYVEKTLAKMFPTPLPYWKEYQWPQQAPIDDQQLIIDPAKVIDISANMNKDGMLNWNAPAGKWVILRTGMLPTGVENAPASKEGTGMEVDKMSSKHVASHFDAFMGEIMRRIPAADRKTWKLTVEDSYEQGGQNWTDGFIQHFKTRYGYDPLPYVPAMYGNVVGSQDKSDRFLWDLRRLVADDVAYEYVGGLRKVANKHGLKTWLENYGHWGFPGEFLQYGGQSDEVGGEFWSEGDLGNIENHAAASCAHIYGKRKVSAESFTAAGNTFGRYPAMMKQRGDRFFTEGINNTLLHVYIQQPFEDKKPGVNAWFGNEFNRFNTWYDDMDLFTAYLKRCNYMLQQGNFVADVVYFIGEDAPKMTGVRDPELPKGYAFDYINAEVIEKRLSVKNDRFVLPDGMSYKVLVLPQLKTMRPELIKKIAALVAQGGIVLGPKPERSPSLENFGTADEEVKKIAASLWGNIDGSSNKINKVGKGAILDGMTMQEALDFVKSIPDVKTSVTDSVLFIHRTIAGGEIYFVSNQTNRQINIEPAFRIKGKKPELWNAIDGSVRTLPSYTKEAQSTIVPLTMDGFESMFIVFRKDDIAATKENKTVNFPAPVTTLNINTPWKVKFDTDSRGPVNAVEFPALTDWTANANDSIKYYSGTAVYSNTFRVNKLNKGENIIIDLGSITAMAKVFVNGKETGGVWTAPYSVDITKAVKEGINKLEIKVVNTWKNRLIGDQKLPEDQRKTWTLVNPYKADSPLDQSGLLGPVVLQFVKY